MGGVSGARLVSGVTVLLATGAVVAAAGLVPAGSPRTAAAVEVPLGGRDAVLACPAAPRLVAVDGAPATDPEFDAHAATDAHVLAVAAGGEEPPQLLVSTPDAPVQGDAAGWLSSVASSTRASSVVRATASGGASPRTSAVQTAVTREGDLRGLAASACARPARTSWLAGGGTVVGRSARLELANPGQTPTTVDVTVLTPAGPLHPAAGQDVVVPGGETVPLLVEGLAPGADALAVGVTASGGRVGAALVDSWLDGLTPRGTEVVLAGSPPQEQAVVPGVVQRPGGSAPSLRVAVPGDEDAVVRWLVHGQAGQVEPDGEAAATVRAGTVTDIPLEGLEPGTYTAVVDADVPVVVSAVSTSGRPDGPADIAWSASSQELHERTLVPLPPEPVDGAVVLSAGEEVVAVDVEALDADGRLTRTTRVTVPARSTVEVPLEDVRTSDTAAVAVTPASGATAVAALVLTAPAADGEPLLSVVPLRPVPPEPGTLRVTLPETGRWP